MQKREFQDISDLFTPLTNNSKEAQNLQDDVCKIQIEDGYELVISKDIIAEDVHFKRSYGARNIAKKLLLCNLSDIAAAGAKPLYYMLGYSKTNDLAEDFTNQFCQGLKEIADQYQISLIGGDTISSDTKLFFSITIFGKVKKGLSLNRSGAKNEDLIFVSGSIGDAFLGLNILENDKNQKDNFLISRHLNPTPRIKLGQNLLENNLANSAIDISDGLLADLNHICKSSNLGATIYKDKIPLSQQAKSFLEENNQFDILDLISAGDDYELLFTAKKDDEQKIMKLSDEIGAGITKIGCLNNSDPEIKFLNKNNQEITIKKLGYQHN